MVVRCAIYARVSKEEQNPEYQVRALEEYASDHGYEVYDRYVDKISGIRSSRPELMRLLKDAHDKKFDIVLVWKLDRLGRSLQHLIKVVSYFEKWGVDFVCTSQSVIDTTTSTGKFIFHIFAALSQFERDLISERTKLALKHAKNVGKRGRDKKPRRKSGNYLRYQRQKKGTSDFDEFSLL